MALYLLFESASGYGIFERVESEEIGTQLEQVQNAINDLGRFSKIMKLVSFLPFTSAENALDNIHHVSEGELSQFLKDFVEQSLPKVKDGKKSKYTLGVTEPKIGNAIQETLNIRCESNDLVLELLRGIRLHFSRFIKAMKPGDVLQAQLGLGHSYSRSKVKFNVNKVDNMIIQSIALLDQLDKDLNTFAMRVREWYSWHFPELVRCVNENYLFCKLAHTIKNKSSLSEESLPVLTEITGDPAKAQEILDAAKLSMGTDISEIDMLNIDRFAVRVMKLAEYRKQLHEYLCSKMSACAPNLAALIGEMVGARLISHAGSLTNLAKYPASTVQILGAEKALFRALKTRGNTPKYGLIFHSTFIGRAAPKNKGRVSRYLANKCSMASRIDCFSELPTSEFGKALRDQVEERLEFYKSGKAPRKNVDAMHRVIEDLGRDVSALTSTEAAKLTNPTTTKTSEEENGEKKKKKKKRSAEEAEMETEESKPQQQQPAEEQPSSKKSKKAKTEKKPAEEQPQPQAMQVETTTTNDKSEKKKKKKKKDESSDE